MINTDFEIANSILNQYIGKKIMDGYTVESNELKKLLEEKKDLKVENTSLIAKILEQYSAEIKKI